MSKFCRGDHSAFSLVRGSMSYSTLLAYDYCSCNSTLLRTWNVNVGAIKYRQFRMLIEDCFDIKNRGPCITGPYMGEINPGEHIILGRGAGVGNDLASWKLSTQVTTAKVVGVERPMNRRIGLLLSGVTLRDIADSLANIATKPWNGA